MIINFYIYTCSDKCKVAILLKASPETWGKSRTEKYSTEMTADMSLMVVKFSDFPTFWFYFKMLEDTKQPSPLLDCV